MPDTPKDAKSIFLAALDLADPAERAALVAQCCRDDDALRHRVEDLLRAYGQPEGPLDKLAAALAPTRLGEPIREQVGATIGPYKLMEQIGEGGFGLVFVAEQQQPIRRKVALKIIKPGMDTRDVIARFEAERQALALMDHPNIARVLDAGTTESGRPYFVMELVRGIPITDYCDQTQLTPRERLELFVPVCNAIQHAHLKGIIHRDVKPSNVLVTMHDAKPVVKVIDFGVAKALHQSLTDRTIYTRFAQMIGTPLYMSPEQAQMSGLDIDTRSDIYSLGVLFYELLTGTTPLDKRRIAKAAYDELLKVIREDEPPKPSLRLSQSGDALPSIAAQRKTEPAKLSKMCSGDLDWIAMKALEKDRTRRYETANAFAADVLRYLNDEPVEASPPSAAYRIRKFARKHRGPVISLAAITTLLVVGIGGTTWGLFRARHAEQAALAAERETDAQREAAESEGKRAREAELRERKQRKTSEAERDRAERELAIGLLRPIGFDDLTSGIGNAKGMSPAEMRSFVDWSSVKDSRLKLHILEMAFEDPETALRIAKRAERVIQSCVGMSPSRRALAVKFVSDKQRDVTADPRIRVAACWLALELGSADLPAWTESCKYLTEPKNESSDRFGEFVNFAGSRSDPQQSAQLNLDPLIAMLETSTDDAVRRRLCGVLPGLAPRLDPPQIARAGDALIAILEKPTNDSVFRDANIVLTVLASRLERAQAKRAANAVIANLENGTYSVAIPEDELKALTPCLEPVQVQRAGDALIALIGKSTESALGGLYPTNRGINALTLRIESAQVRRAGEALIAILENPTDSYVLHKAHVVLTILAPRLEPTQVKRAGDVLIASLERSTDTNYLVEANEGVTELAPRLEPAQVKRAWDAVIANGTNRSMWEDMGHGLVLPDNVLRALGPRLDVAQSKRAGDAALTMLEQSTDVNALNSANGVLEVLAPRLDKAQVRRAATALVTMLQKPTATSVRALVALGPRLDSADVKRAGDALIGMLAQSVDGYVLNAANDVLAALAPRLDASQSKLAADALIGILKKSTDKWVVHLAATNGLRTLAPRLEPTRLTCAWDALVGAPEKLTRGSVQNDPVWAGLVSLAPRLEPASRNNLSTTATAAVLDYCSSFDPNQNGGSFVGQTGLAKSIAVARSISSPHSLAKLLSHPACVAEQREVLLKRFEELVFHHGKPVILMPDATDGKKTPGEELPPRRFHSLHDAEDWIQQNWPDFDLETNCPATWRGAR
jgi:serine/threonine protein kinase